MESRRGGDPDQPERHVHGEESDRDRGETRKDSLIPEQRSNAGAANTLGRLLRRARGRICVAIGTRDPESRIGVALEVLAPPRVLPVLSHETTERRGPPLGMKCRSLLQAGEDPSVGGLTGHPWPASTARASDGDRSGADFLVVLRIDHRDSSHILPDANMRSLACCRSPCH